METKKAIFLSYTEKEIQHIAQRVIRRKLKPKEIRLLKAKTIVAIHNTMIKIDSCFLHNS